MVGKCVRVAVASLALALAAPGWAGGCYGPKWQQVTDPIIGATFEMSATPTRSFYLAYGTDVPSVSIDEMARPGGEIPGRCSSFGVAMQDFAPLRISDPEGLFDKKQADAIKRLTNGRIVYSRKLKVGGFPAREYRYSFNIDFFGTPATHRTLLVARNNQLLMFTSVWGDAEGPPQDSNRSFASIRLLDAVPSPDVATLALLQETVKKYWMFPSPRDSQGIYLSPSLRAAFDRTRERDSAVIKAFGYPRDTQVVRRSGGAKVVRIVHDSATVEWTVSDNGKQITALSWRKL